MVSVLDADWSRQRRSYAKVTDFLDFLSLMLFWKRCIFIWYANM